MAISSALTLYVGCSAKRIAGGGAEGAIGDPGEVVKLGKGQLFA